MKNWLKITIGIILSILIITVIGGFILFNLLKNSLPEYSDEFVTDKIINSVSIYRDDFAIPYIFAQTEKDVAFTIGYVHSQERLFQMDLMRRSGQGRLSELFGNRTILFDKMFRIIGIERIAKRMYENANPKTKEMLKAYADGVNYFIEKNKNNWGIEFDILNYEPEKWKPEHSMIIVRMIAWGLNISWWTDIAFTNISQKIGIEKTNEILPDYDENFPTIIPSELKNYPEISLNLIEVDKAFRSFIGFNGTHIGSNNWVVNGMKSKTGKPIIANDPHLAHQSPGVWYLLSIHSPLWNATGVTFPGVPGIVIGKNEFIAWTVTNVMADDADFYIEQFDSTNSKYLFNNQWLPLNIIKDTIKVKDSADVVIKIKSTHRGPIISDIHLYNEMFSSNSSDLSNHRQTNISMRWTGNDVSDEYYAYYLINHSKNWNEFKSALKYFTVPGQNFVYADKEGNIGYYCAVKLPIRDFNNPSFIYDGTTDKYDWKGFVPFDELPSLFNPKDNYIATANNKTIENYKYHISNIWEPPSRIQRITELINSKQKLSVNDYEKMQMDFVSPYAKDVTKFIIDAFKNIKITDKNLQITLQLFENWNYEMDKYSQLPTIYVMFLDKLLKNILLDELGENLFYEYCFIANVPYRLITKMLKENNSGFFDNKNTSNIEMRDEIIRKSLSDALDELEKNFGDNIADWQWGNLHKVTFNHFFSGENKMVDKTINIGPFPIGGDGTTIFNTEYPFYSLKNEKQNLENKFKNVLGPSMRFIYDFSNENECLFILPTGESGHPLSPHYKDMTNLWFNGKYIKVYQNEDDIKRISKNLIIMRNN